MVKVFYRFWHHYVGTVCSSASAFPVLLPGSAGSLLVSALVCQRRARGRNGVHCCCSATARYLATLRQGRNETDGSSRSWCLNDAHYACSLSPVRLLIALMGRLPGTMPPRIGEASSRGQAGASISTEEAKSGAAASVSHSGSPLANFSDGATEERKERPFTENMPPMFLYLFVASYRSGRPPSGGKNVALVSLERED